MLCADWLTMVTIHRGDQSDLYIQWGTGAFCKHLEEQLAILTEERHICHVSILPGTLRPSLLAFLKRSLLFTNDGVHFLSKVEIPTCSPQSCLHLHYPFTQPYPAPLWFVATSFLLRAQSHHLKAKVKCKFQVAECFILETDFLFSHLRRNFLVAVM